MSVEYWQRRALTRTTQSEAIGKDGIRRLNVLYKTAEKNILKEIRSIYDNYAKNGVLDVTELRRGLDDPDSFLRSLEDKAEQLGLDPREVYDRRYLSRLTRLQALQEQLRWEAMSLAPGVEGQHEQTYRQILERSYISVQSDLAVIGIVPSFATLDKRVIDEIMRSRWAGRNFSASVWQNTGELAAKLPDIVGAGLVSGTSSEKMAAILRKQFNIERYKAVRLVRTETNYFHNQAELQSYLDDGIEEYEYLAVLDGRTSDICRELDGRVFRVEDAVVGENYPAMHPNCRSSTVIVAPRKGFSPGDERHDTSRLTEYDSEPVREHWLDWMATPLAK